MDIFFHGFYVFSILFLIVFACVVFTNAIEHLGEELNLSEGTVGSVLAAVGTALPETIVPLVAILGAYIAGGDMHVGSEIGVGAILGAPFLLGTLAFFVSGLAVVLYTKSGRRNSDMPVNTSIMFRDMHYFALGYTISILSSFIPNMVLKHAVAILLIVLYGVYVFRTVRDGCKGEHCDIDLDADGLEPLYLAKLIKLPERFNLALVVFQVLLSLLGIIFLAHFFVEQLKFFSELFKINPLILSLIITPIATELPEKFNSVIWIRAKKDTLAMGNITGAMVFQSCIPTAVGISLTPWILGRTELFNVITVYLSVGVVYLNILRNKGVLKPSALLTGGIFYLLYIFYVVLLTAGFIKA